MQPAMKPKELSLYKEYLAKARRYVESGCGGTTMLAIDSGVEKIDVIETDIAWIEKLKQHPKVNEAVANGRVTFHHAEIGEVIQWGIPKDRSHLSNWPFFSLGFWNHVDGPADFVLIDGRFRVAACIAAMIMCEPETPIMLHDFIGREHFLPILDLVETIDQVDTALVFHRKPDLTDPELILAWTNYMYDAR